MIGYVPYDLIKKNVEDIPLHKVFIPKAAGTGNDPIVVGKPELFPENSVCSQTFLYAGFTTETEAKNFISYIQTKFFRALVSACKISQDLPSKTYRFVPQQDFSKPWSDEELYQKYDLSSDDIAYIESHIKSFDRPLP